MLRQPYAEATHPAAAQDGGCKTGEKSHFGYGKKHICNENPEIIYVISYLRVLAIPNGNGRGMDVKSPFDWIGISSLSNLNNIHRLSAGLINYKIT